MTEQFTLRSIEELPSIHGGAVKLAGAELGVESFGLQVLDFPGGFANYPEHDHAADGQEEVYLVLGGSAEFELDGEHVRTHPGTLVRVPSQVRRKITPGADGVRILAIGCTPNGAYERPEGFRLEVRA
jgi:mannose-6-phosphate isomerase-like protein (cupin superfamily)